ncbi:MAG: nitroreductase family protein [Thermoplasmata archaeon]
MEKNSVIQTILNHKSVRKYKDDCPSQEEIETIVRAGQQAPFVSQLYSVLLSRKRDEHPFGAPLMFTICVDAHKMERVMQKRGWKMVTNDLSLLLFGIQDAAYMAQNMVTAGESMGIGSVFLGRAIYIAERIKEEYGLPEKVFPLVQLAMGYPDEDEPPRPRYPMDFVLFEGEYPKLTDEMVEDAMEEMDRGYLDQDYYHKLDAKIGITGDKDDEFTYEDYSWTEHISRKWGQWYDDLKIPLKQVEVCGFTILLKEED